MSVEKQCVNCRMWAEYTDGTGPAELRKGECLLPTESESLIKSFVRIRFVRAGQQSLVGILTEEECLRLGIQEIYPGFICNGDFFCAAFDSHDDQTFATETESL
jgi:hypothetical protein